MAYGIIYHWHCAKTNMGYVGQTMNTLMGRWRGHVASAFGDPSHRSFSWELPKAIREYGPNSFVGRIICECETPQELSMMEDRWMHELNTLWPNGYNMRNGTNFVCERARQLMSLAKVGKPLSVEHKQRISEALTGHPNWGPPHHTNDAKRKQSDANRGKRPYEMTDEIRERISQAKRGSRAWNKGMTSLPAITREKLNRTLDAKHATLLELARAGLTLSEIVAQTSLPRGYIRAVLRRAVERGSLASMPAKGKRACRSSSRHVIEHVGVL